MLKAKKIQKSYGSMTALSDVSFSLEQGQKVALVGGNGTGKTTLLKIVAGLESVDAGEIEFARGICVGYLPQDTSLVSDETISSYLKRVTGIDQLEDELEEFVGCLDDPVKAQAYSNTHERYEHLNGYAFDHRMRIMLAGFGFDDPNLEQRLTDLSSGQKSKVVLAGILLKGVDLLLLDEPTNNLDLPALVWLEDFLQKSGAACIIVSHDRRFLDRVVKKIFEIDEHDHTLTVSNGVYSSYLEMKAKRLARQKTGYLLQQEEIDRLSKQARQKRTESSRGSHWSGSDNDKFLQGFKRDQAGRSSRVAKSIEKRIEQMEKIEKPFEREPFEIRLEAETSNGLLDISIVNVVAGYKNNFTIGPLSFEVRYGNRVGIMGLNGSGKTTLLRTITGQLSPLSGLVQVGSGVRIGNMMQEHETLTRDNNPLGILMERAHLNRQESYSQLAKFGFNEKRANSAIEALSPGGRARLLLALFSAQSVNVLVLDEPTNHLDLEALDALEEMLQTYRGTVLVVSHDRYFLEHARFDSVYVLSDGMLSKILDYQSYVIEAEARAQKLLKSL